VELNVEAPSRNHFSHGKAISITYFECVSVALVIQHEMCMRPIAICGLSGSSKFFHIISQTARLSKRRFIAYKLTVSLQLLPATSLFLRQTNPDI
jgi:hypothetical protein